MRAPDTVLHVAAFLSRTPSNEVSVVGSADSTSINSMTFPIESSNFNSDSVSDSLSFNDSPFVDPSVSEPQRETNSPDHLVGIFDPIEVAVFNHKSSGSGVEFTLPFVALKVASPGSANLQVSLASALVLKDLVRSLAVFAVFDLLAMVSLDLVFFEPFSSADFDVFLASEDLSTFTFAVDRNASVFLTLGEAPGFVEFSVSIAVGFSALDLTSPPVVVGLVRNEFNLDLVRVSDSPLNSDSVSDTLSANNAPSVHPSELVPVHEPDSVGSDVSGTVPFPGLGVIQAVSGSADSNIMFSSASTLEPFISISAGSDSTLLLALPAVASSALLGPLHLKSFVVFPAAPFSAHSVAVPSPADTLMASGCALDPEISVNSTADSDSVLEVSAPPANDSSNGSDSISDSDLSSIANNITETPDKHVSVKDSHLVSDSNTSSALENISVSQKPSDEESGFSVFSDSHLVSDSDPLVVPDHPLIDDDVSVSSVSGDENSGIVLADSSAADFNTVHSFANSSGSVNTAISLVVSTTGASADFVSTSLNTFPALDVNSVSDPLNLERPVIVPASPSSSHLSAVPNLAQNSLSSSFATGDNFHSLALADSKSFSELSAMHTVNMFSFPMRNTDLNSVRNPNSPSSSNNPSVSHHPDVNNSG